MRLADAREKQRKLLGVEVSKGDGPATMQLAVLLNDIEEAAFQDNEDKPIKLTTDEKTKHDNEWRTYRERNAQLVKQ